MDEEEEIGELKNEIKKLFLVILYTVYFHWKYECTKTHNLHLL